MWDPLTKIIEKYPQYTLILIAIYAMATTLVAGYRWIYSAIYEAKKDYLAKLVTYSEDVSETVAKIATSTSYPREEIGKFWAYYYGKLILVEDDILERKMIAFGVVLETVTEDHYGTRTEQDVEKIKDAALDVSGACRDLIKKSWRLSIIPWQDLQKSKTKTSEANWETNPKASAGLVVKRFTSWRSKRSSQ